MLTLGALFISFCAFGAVNKGGPALMDSAKFAKVFRDLKILDKKVTATDVDIVFSKVKAKTERKITFDQFEDALKLLAEKKYPGDKNAFNKLKEKMLEAKGPLAHSTKTEAADAVDRLTDSSKYTGTFKDRFDESGKGKGTGGRKDLSNDSGYVGGFKH